MAEPADRVQVIKQESSALGGDDADAVEWGSSPIEPQEDAIEAAGLYLQDGTHRDESALIWRDGNNIKAKDTAHGTVTLLDSASGLTVGQHVALDTLVHALAEDYHMSKVLESGKISKIFYSQKTGTSITAFADAGGGKVTVTSAGHGLVTNSEVVIKGTTNYDGDYVVSNPLTNTFEITATWVSDDATGTWRKKIRATELTRAGGKVSQADEIQYDGDGIEYARMSEAITRVDGKVDTIDATKTGGP